MKKGRKSCWSISNLKKLHNGSKFPKWVGNPSSFASLEEINIIDCEQIRSLPPYIHDSPGKLDTPISKCMLEKADNSAVSPILDDTTDCNLGQFLQLGLPCGCSLQSLVHNNAEQSVADKELVGLMNCEMEDNDCNHDKNPLYDNYPFSHSMMVNHLTIQMEPIGSSSSNQPYATSIRYPGPSRRWQLSLAEPPMICPQQQDLAVPSPYSQPFKPTARQSDATVTYIDHDDGVVSPIFDAIATWVNSYSFGSLLIAAHSPWYITMQNHHYELAPPY
ncbi:hypothetical protein COCNU_01G000020 [Cocos nucifera]|uniref:Uncharacterized protein n=1 Tax=Cocos nucifera TaxID=13894 RepID=A0A8K0MTX9_COCNU|nr:hypothetical protein COCNU_01G000020 [Cocos nucifera]